MNFENPMFNVSNLPARETLALAATTAQHTQSGHQSAYTSQRGRLWDCGDRDCLNRPATRNESVNVCLANRETHTSKRHTTTGGRGVRNASRRSIDPAGIDRVGEKEGIRVKTEAGYFVATTRA